MTQTLFSLDCEVKCLNNYPPWLSSTWCVHQHSFYSFSFCQSHDVALKIEVFFWFRHLCCWLRKYCDFCRVRSSLCFKKDWLPLLVKVPEGGTKESGCLCLAKVCCSGFGVVGEKKFDLFADLKQASKFSFLKNRSWTSRPLAALVGKIWNG